MSVVCCMLLFVVVYLLMWFDCWLLFARCVLCVGVCRLSIIVVVCFGVFDGDS